MESAVTRVAEAPLELAKEVDAWREISRIPCTLNVALAVPCMKVRDLLALDVGSIVDSFKPVGSSLPVHVNGIVIALAEFDVVGARLAVLINELK